jgi:tetratricopeptide (TPR) repeat protein
MRVQRKLFLFLLLLAFKNGLAQPYGWIDSLKNELAKAQTPGDKVYILDILSRRLMNVKLEEGEKYGKQIIEVAEESRNRKLMVKAYQSNGYRCSYFAGKKDYLLRSVEYYNNALQIAKENKLDEEMGAVLLQMAVIQLYIPDREKALSYLNQANSIIATLENDSLKIETNYKFGDVYLSRNEKILSLRSYLTGLRMAEEIKAKGKVETREKIVLIRSGNINLSGFYSSIGDYDKALDYYTTAMQESDKLNDIGMAYQRVSDVNSIGSLYAAKKNNDLAMSYFERSIAIADSLKFPSLKRVGYVSLLNQYLREDDPKKALAFFNSERGSALKNFLTVFGFTGVVEQAYAVIYTEIGQYDSALYYFNKAMPSFENGMNEFSKMGFYMQLGRYYRKTEDYPKSIGYFVKVKEMGERAGQLENVQAVALQLDSIYTVTGDFKSASEYNALQYKYKDSIDKINKEKELVQVEAANEQLKMQRIEREKAEAKKKRYAIQYFGITIAIATLIVVLVMLGMFKVSTTTIKMLGFFTFLMLFEFLFLIFKKNITSVTEGEPWKDLMFMIGLAAILLPLHHWLEHKVIHHLTSHNRLTSAGKELKTRLFARKKVGHD